jgi:hypothetical protein
MVSFLIGYILLRLDFLGWTFIKRPFLYLGQQFDSITVQLYVSGLFLLAVGFWILSSRGLNRFIDKGFRSTTGTPLQPT